MTARERVLTTLKGGRADRTPLNVFAGWNPGVVETVSAKWGNLEQWYDRFEIDVVTGVLPRFAFGAEISGTVDEVADFLAMDMIDPKATDAPGSRCDGPLFPTVRDAVAWGRRTERAVFVHGWGVFELSQFLFERDGRPGTEDALLNMLAEKDAVAQLFLKLADWSAQSIELAIEAGADAVELSDDWGQQNTMLFSPQLWWDLVYPATKHIVDRVRALNRPILLHSDGDITKVLDGVVKLGLDGLHPVQESAGMDFNQVRGVLGRERCIMGGLDTVSSLPRMNVDEIRSEVGRVFDLLAPSGPFIFAGSHMFQDDADLAVIEAAYEQALASAEEWGATPAEDQS
jgi:uroporphyrinogen decarboxylase